MRHAQYPAAFVARQVVEDAELLRVLAGHADRVAQAADSHVSSMRTNVPGRAWVPVGALVQKDLELSVTDGQQEDFDRQGRVRAKPVRWWQELHVDRGCAGT